MVAETLRLAGLYLGTQDDLLPASEFNPRGYFEHRGFVALNDEVLAALGGAWDKPPQLRLPWVRRRLQPLIEHAEALVAEMRSRSPWGWKDPRTCLTLPFWLKVVPELRVVSVVRSAVAVASSLEVRGGAPPDVSLSLWAEYNGRLLNAAPRRRTIVTSYDAYVESPERELARVVHFLGLDVGAEAIARASAAAQPVYRHHLAGGRELPLNLAQLERRLFALAAE